MISSFSRVGFLGDFGSHEVLRAAFPSHWSAEVLPWVNYARTARRSGRCKSLIAFQVSIDSVSVSERGFVVHRKTLCTYKISLSRDFFVPSIMTSRTNPNHNQRLIVIFVVHFRFWAAAIFTRFFHQFSALQIDMSVRPSIGFFSLFIRQRIKQTPETNIFGMALKAISLTFSSRISALAMLCVDVEQYSAHGTFSRTILRHAWLPDGEARE